MKKLFPFPELVKILAVSVAALTLGHSTAARGQSTNSLSFWTGAAGDGLWNTVGPTTSNWNFGPANLPSSAAPQDQLSKGVLFTDEAAFPTTERDIKLSSNVNLSTGEFVVRSGTFTFDINGHNLSAGDLIVGDGVAGNGNIDFENSSATFGAVSFRGMTLGANGSSNNTFGSDWGSDLNVNFSGGSLQVGSLGGHNNSFSVLAGQDYSFTSLTVGISSDTGPNNNNKVVVDGGTLHLAGRITLNGGYYDDSNPLAVIKSDNLLHITNGGQVIHNGTGTNRTTIGKGSSLIVEGDGSLYQTNVNTMVEANGLLRVTGGNSKYISGTAITSEANSTIEILDGGSLEVNTTMTASGAVVLNGGSQLFVAGNATFLHATGIGLTDGSVVGVGGNLTFGSDTVKVVQTITGGGEIVTTTGNLAMGTQSSTVNSEVIVDGEGSKLTITGQWRTNGNANLGKVKTVNGGEFRLGEFQVLQGSLTIPVEGTVILTGTGIRPSSPGDFSQVTVGSGTTVVLLAGQDYDWGNNKLILASGGTLAGSTSNLVTGQGIWLAGGEISAGYKDEPGQLNVGSIVVDGSQSTLTFDIYGREDGQYDQIHSTAAFSSSGGSNAVAYNVALRLGNGYVPGENDSFHLVTGGFGGGSADSTITFVDLPAIGGTLDWDRSQYNSKGVVSVYDTAATGNSSRLYVGASEVEGGTVIEGGSLRLAVGASGPKIDVKNAGEDSTSYTVSTTGTAITGYTTTGLIDGLSTSQISLMIDTSKASTGLGGASVIINNAATSYNGSNPTSGNRDQDDVVNYANVVVVANRDITGSATTVDFGKMFTNQQSGNKTTVLSGGTGAAAATNAATTVRLLGSATSIATDGVTAKSSSAGILLFNSATTRNIVLSANFATSGVRDTTINVAGLLQDGEAASVGAVVDTDVKVKYKADVYQRASLYVGVAHEGPVEAGDTVVLGNDNTSDGGQRAAASIVSRVLSGAGWSMTGFDIGTILAQNSSVQGTFAYDNGTLLNGVVRTGSLTLGLQHTDQSILGAAAGDLGTTTIDLKHTVTGQTAGFGTQFSSGALAAGASYNGLGLTRSGGGTQARLLGGTTGSGTTLLMSFGAAPAGGVLVSDVLHLQGTGTDNYVLSLTYDAGLFATALAEDPDFVPTLGWLNGDSEWVNAVLGNTGMVDDWETVFSSYYREGAYLDTYGVGTYGWDAATGSVWAVLNHNSDFGVIGVGAVPEPGRAILLILGLAAACLRRKRRVQA